MPIVVVPPPSSWVKVRRIAAAFLLLLLFLAGAGFLYENIAEARDRRFNRMPGKLVDVAGNKMHLYCTGDGTPTVLLESGLGDSFISWRKVQPEIAKLTRVCSYDRAGLGYSDPSSGPRTSKVIAEQLHELLQAAKIAPPYVLAGHSMGGYDVRLYASLCPSEVAGMVLVDSSHPDQENRFPPELKKIEAGWRREAQFAEYGMPIGIPRLMGLCDENAGVRAAECNLHSAREALAELDAFPESAAQTAATGPLGDMPLAVLSQDTSKPSNDLPLDIAKPTNEAWDKMQEELAHLSTRGTRTVAKNSSHYIQLDRPDVFIEGVRQVLAEVAHPPAQIPSQH
jgi:pimeloyl-ACP methyl ester carboxylesterase